MPPLCYQDYFDLQLRFAARYALLAGISLSEGVALSTNLRRRFGLWGSAGEVEWDGFLRQIEGGASHPEILRVAMTRYGSAPRRSPSPFGCFTYDTPDAHGSLRLHFMPEERHRQTSPLTLKCLPERRAELRGLFMEVHRLYPNVREVRGLSWLYHLPGYRSLFPKTYVASIRPATGPLNMTGSSTWGQVVDYRLQLRPGIADRILGLLSPSTVDAPWLAFPLQPMSAVGPASDFFDWFVKRPDRRQMKYS